MKANAIKYFSIYVLLLSAYNPLTTFIFNKTGFHGAMLHYIMMIIGWLVFLFLNLKSTIKAVSHKQILVIFLILSYTAFSLINGIAYGSLRNSIADVAYFIEVWMFYLGAMICIKSTPIQNIMKVYQNVFIINGVGLVIIFFFLNNELYFALQFGSTRVSRLIDFLIISGLLLVFYGKKPPHFSVIALTSLSALFVFVNMIGFSRAIWFTFILVMFVDYSLRMGVSLYSLRVTIKPVNLLLLVLFMIILVLFQIYFSSFDFVIDRLTDLDYDTSSIGGRVSAYFSLFFATFSDYGVMIAGKGAGALMPGLNISASSSPSFMLSFLYIHGVLIFFILIVVLGVFSFRLLKLSSINNAPFNRFPIYNLLAHLLILNIFPSVNHFPILGFLVFVSAVMLAAKGKR